MINSNEVKVGHISHKERIGNNFKNKKIFSVSYVRFVAE